MHWRSFKPWEKGVIVFFVAWCLVGPLLAIQSPRPLFILSIPFLLVVAGFALLWALERIIIIIDWLRRALAR